MQLFSYGNTKELNGIQSKFDFTKLNESIWPEKLSEECEVYQINFLSFFNKRNDFR